MAKGKKGTVVTKGQTKLPTATKAANKFPGATESSKESCNMFEEERGAFCFHVCFHVCFSASLETYSTEGSGAVIDETPIGEAGDALQVSFQI